MPLLLIVSGVFAITALIVVAAITAGLVERFRINRLPPDQRRVALDRAQAQLDTTRYGAINPLLVCPHCQHTGAVRAIGVKRKTGISGAKATGAVLTGGVSVLATGLSRKESVTQARCDRCKSVWTF